jgi:hypothetical protein
MTVTRKLSVSLCVFVRRFIRREEAMAGEVVTANRELLTKLDRTDNCALFFETRADSEIETT